MVCEHNDVKIDKQYHQLLQDNRELNLAVDKRFRGKRTLYCTPDYRSLVYLCLSTNAYRVSSSFFRSISDDDVTLAWQFIDTASVSSTAKCRLLINRGKRDRNGAGFARSMEKDNRTIERRARTRYGTRLSMQGAAPDDVKHYKTEHSTLYEVAMEDCMRWLTHSPDPAKLAATLRSNILGGTQGA